MLSLILLLPLDRLEFLALDLAGLLHLLGQMSMSFDTFNLRHVLIPFLQRLVVLELLALAS